VRKNLIFCLNPQINATLTAISRYAAFLTREKKGEDDGAKYNLEKKSAKFIFTISIFLEYTRDRRTAYE
jgi:hypothetical protein